MDKRCTKCEQTKSLTEFHYKKTENRFHSWCKVCVYAFQKSRWKDRKSKAVELMGGSCSACGYDRNYASLDFHHVDPSLKEFDWTKMRLQPWDVIIDELKKCILLCRNCHGEVHHPEMAKSPGSGNDNNSLNERIGITLRSTGVCPMCCTAVFGTKYCSARCAAKGSRKVERPSKDELSSLLGNHGFSAIGRQFGVSDNAVRKWAKFYGLLK